MMHPWQNDLPLLNDEATAETRRRVDEEARPLAMYALFWLMTEGSR